MYFECYLDDSKDKSQQFAYVCAGLYGGRDTWKKFCRLWNKQLELEQLEYFKSSECSGLRDQFERFREKPAPEGRLAANAVRDRFKQIIRVAEGVRGVGAVVPVAEFTRVLEHEGAQGVFSPKYIYHRAFELTILKAKLLTCMSRLDRIGFVHDAGDDFAQLHMIFRDFKRKNPKTAPYLKGFLSGDDRSNPALQAADLFANNIMGTTMNFLNDKQGTSSEDIVKFNRSRIAVWTKRFGEIVLARNMKNRELSIPESLADAYLKTQHL